MILMQLPVSERTCVDVLTLDRLECLSKFTLEITLEHQLQLVSVDYQHIISK